jgi:UPF0755 protein
MKKIMKNINVLRKSSWIAWVENITLVLIISLTFYSLLPIDTHLKTEKIVHIPQNATAKSIISQLGERGYDIGFIDQIILSNLGKLPQGQIILKKNILHRIDFLALLTTAKIPLVKITLIPGETLDIFLDIVADKLEVNASKLSSAYQKLAKYPEASIAADTYLAPKKMNEHNLIKFLLTSSENAYKKLALKNYNDYNQTQWHRILTIASIIQKEAANNKEMPLIASVIYNRLAKNMRLQMDGTLNYGKYSHIKVTPERIKNDTSSFNTYKHRGLPDSPIGAVSQYAILAAIHPKKTNYLFFMRNKHGLHDFTDTFKKHRKNIIKVK